MGIKFKNFIKERKERQSNLGNLPGRFAKNALKFCGNKTNIFLPRLLEAYSSAINLNAKMPTSYA